MASARYANALQGIVVVQPDLILVILNRLARCSLENNFSAASMTSVSSLNRIGNNNFSLNQLNLLLLPSSEFEFGYFFPALDKLPKRL